MSGGQSHSMVPTTAGKASPALSAALAMTQDDIDRITKASKALQACLTSLPVPTKSSKKAPAASSTPETQQKDEAPKTSDCDADETYLISRDSIHKLMDRKGGARVLHEMLLEAAKQCDNELIDTFLPRLSASGASDDEAKAGIVIFHELDKSSKLKLVFELLAAAETENAHSSSEGSEKAADNKNDGETHHKENAPPSEKNTGAPNSSTPNLKPPSTPTLNRDGASSLFKTILLSITCSVHRDKDSTATLKPSVTKDDDMSEKSSEEPTEKGIKSETSDSPNLGSKEGSPASLQVNSFDTSLPSLSGDDGGTPSNTSVSGLPEELQKEIDETASRAAGRLAEFALQKRSKGDTNDTEVSVTFEMFGDWYNSGGCAVVPWLELLHLSKWRVTAPLKSASHVIPSGCAASSSASETVSLAQRKTKHQLPTNKTAPKSSLKDSTQCGHGLSYMLKEDKESMRKHFSSGQSRAIQHQSNRTVVSFDFSSSSGSSVARTSRPLCINISEENLGVLRALVYRSGLIYRSAAEVCKTILRMSHKRIWDGRPLVTLRREDFRNVIRALIYPAPGSSTKARQSHLSQADAENFGAVLEDFFACFEGNFHQSTTAYHPLSHDEVNVKELAVGFCFLCTGNKSTKLATGFELLDDARSGILTQQQLMRFFRSYLTMLVAMSLLKEEHAENRHALSHGHLQEMRAAVENGAHWTLGHFLTFMREKHPQSHMKDSYSFENFASWYSTGGYAVAPWLELLDLNKLVSLAGESESFAAIPQSRHHSLHSSSQSAYRECRSSHRRTHHNRASTPPAQVLFTFPLANQRSLIVLREDAVYVRGVVEQLGLISLTADSIWTSITNEVKKRTSLNGGLQARTKKTGPELEKNYQLDQKTFVDVMEIILMSAASLGKKRSADGSSKLSSSVNELLTNFFHSYDLKQTNTVAINELMGGLMLLCGGKKSSKLAFSFGVFDGRAAPKGKGKNANQTLKNQSLDAGDLFLFLRSVLIVLFSCCCQTLDMSNSSVDRYIADTANMVADDVMRYQYHTRQKERVDFDEFGEWYNEGGFEIAPWLELLDLKKWVLVDNFDALDAQNAAAVASSTAVAKASSSTEAFAASPLPPSRLGSSIKSPRHGHDPNCPPPPPEDVLDPSFFEDNDADDLMHMDSMGEMDIMLMPSHDTDDGMIPVSKFSYSPSKDKNLSDHHSQQDQQSLKFHLASEEKVGGFMMSISQKRIRHLRQLLVQTGIHNVDPETACTKILSRASGSSKPKSKVIRTITKREFLSAYREIVDIGDKIKDDGPLAEVMSCIFAAFDVKQNGKPNALELACGFTVLCQGKKSDKLEYAFEVLDKNKCGQLSRDGMFNYMRSFLTVLVSLACAPSLDNDNDEDKFTTMTGEACERNTQSVIRAVDAGSKWAVSQAFKTGLHGTEGPDAITFDDFGQWYTQSGYTLIPWIELLDLGKWCV